MQISNHEQLMLEIYIPMRNRLKNRLQRDIDLAEQIEYNIKHIKGEPAYKQEARKTLAELKREQCLEPRRGKKK